MKKNFKKKKKEFCGRGRPQLVYIPGATIGVLIIS